jgi:uracil-DNA glycosylase
MATAPASSEGVPVGQRRRDELAHLASSCQACDLYRDATQIVFGQGPVPARLMLVGEQPGDREDIEGAPFVGPAGEVLDRACEEAGIDRHEAYVTNAVKHFKWERRGSGKVRVHKQPNAAEIRACRPWWESELALVQPDVVCCLGATAAQAVLGPKVRVTRDHGKFVRLEITTADAITTVHPSAVLRARGDREAVFAGLVKDLRVVAARLT